jgi:hypothetical protein
MTSAIKVGLLVSIAIVFPLMVGLGTEAFYPSPRMSEKCESMMRLEDSGEMTESERATMDKCEKEFIKEMETYNRNIFIPVTIIGFLALAAGALFISEAMGPVAPGLVFGGVLTILYASMRGFTAVDKRWLFIELVIVLIGLILVTRRFLSQAKTKK